MPLNKRDLDQSLQHEAWKLDDNKLIFGPSLGSYDAINGALHMFVTPANSNPLTADGYYQIYSDSNGNTHLQIDIGGDKKDAIVEAADQIVLLNEDGAKDILIPTKQE